jgi:hypothetical protein
MELLASTLCVCVFVVIAILARRALAASMHAAAVARSIGSWGKLTHTPGMRLDRRQRGNGARNIVCNL